MVTKKVQISTELKITPVDERNGALVRNAGSVSINGFWRVVFVVGDRGLYLWLS